MIRKIFNFIKNAYRKILVILVIWILIWRIVNVMTTYSTYKRDRRQAYQTSIEQWIELVEYPEYILEPFSDTEYYHLTNNVTELGNIKSITLEYKVGLVIKWINLEGIDKIYYKDIENNDTVGLSINQSLNIVLITY